ncbi:glycosyltransferase family 2 protein [Larkinella terrae]|uniref:Glycosyltransferase n=1 Tax=Larkinella terrae TaxID=2025311 RepID=A0A7K0EKA8_9BACT|nr:glycosyltransferase family 2 protein [Larkinella terrae]MRS62215.1 glycosyltransferase [Larkinella terrae]
MNVTSIIEILVAICVLMVFYTYLGYGIVVWGMVVFKRIFVKYNTPVLKEEFCPEVTLVVPAFNEIAYIKDKVKNCLDQDYPATRLHLMFVDDGSTDGTGEYLDQVEATSSRITVVRGGKRMGKIGAINNAMGQVHTPITVFSDANANLNLSAVSNMVRHYQDEKVGAVAGEKRILTAEADSAAGSGEGIYWKYESFLKKMDSELHSIVGADGALFSIRTNLYETVATNTLLDDFIISLQIAGKGFRVIYEPDAYAMESPSFSVGDEKKRKVRIAAGGFQAISRLTYLLNILKYGILSFQYISHRVLRWAVTPFCLPLIWLLNVVIFLSHLEAQSPTQTLVFWGGLLIAQTIFYAFAYLGYLLENRKMRWKIAFVPYYFVFMNWCVILGFIRYLKQNESGIWEKARRAA